MSKFRLTKGDSDDIGFVRTCLIAGIIDFGEFKEWLYYVIGIDDDGPLYFWDLLDLKERADFVPLRILGFSPGCKHTNAEDRALDGIGYKRYPDYESDFVKRKTALSALEKNKHIEERFRQLFPFIVYSDV